MTIGDTLTPNIKLTRIEPDRKNWADKLNGDLTIIDAVIGTYFEVNTLKGEWANSATYNEGDVVADGATGQLWQCRVSNVSAPVPTTFAEERANHTSYWTTVSISPSFRGAWLTATFYENNDFVIQNSNYYICRIAHTSGVFATDLAASKWELLVDTVTIIANASAAAAIAAAAAASPYATAASASATAAAASAVAAAASAAAASVKYVLTDTRTIAAPTATISFTGLDCEDVIFAFEGIVGDTVGGTINMAVSINNGAAYGGAFTVGGVGSATTTAKYFNMFLTGLRLGYININSTNIGTPTATGINSVVGSPSVYGGSANVNAKVNAVQFSYGGGGNYTGGVVKALTRG